MQRVSTAHRVLRLLLMASDHAALTLVIPRAAHLPVRAIGNFLRDIFPSLIQLVLRL